MKLKSTLSKDGSMKADATSDEFVVLTSEEIALAPSLGQDSSTLLVQLEADLVAQLKVAHLILNPTQLVFLFLILISFQNLFRLAQIIVTITN